MIVKFLVVQGRPKDKAIKFGNGEFLFGRGMECHVRPNSEWVSRQHCLLRVTPDAVFLRDLASRNGTLVNGTLVVEDRLLAHGDLVQVGPLVFEVQLELVRPVKSPTVLSGSDPAATPVSLHGEEEVPVPAADSSDGTDSQPTLPASLIRSQWPPAPKAS
jgi:pSer/pThr/pTyr-binding forkhead associated (FHA) protein